MCLLSSGHRKLTASINFSYSYNFASSMDTEVDGRRLRLATFGGCEQNPAFFSGRLLYPRKIAEVLLTLSAISRTRFFSPGMLRERMVAAADPVVTSDGERLRFEVFSVCCGAYARFDMAGDVVQGDWYSRGTTNVDFNPHFRAALGAIQDSDKVTFRVGADSVELLKENEIAIERKVKLPVRWLKGFVEVQAYQSVLKPGLEISSADLGKLLLSMPEQNLLQAGVVTYITPILRGYRLSQRKVSGALGVGAISRLKAVESLLRYATTIRTYTSDRNVTAFELEMKEGRFTLLLSPRADRGFSGEGQVLGDIAGRVLDDLIASVRAQLAWQNMIDCNSVARTVGCSAEDAKNALSVLGARGLVGYDIASGSYFHRELPFDLELIEELQPRLVKARKLLEQQSVTIIERQNGAGIVSANVRGTSGEHLVQFGEDVSRCTCEWHSKHGETRGPCSHLLALELKLQECQS